MIEKMKLSRVNLALNELKFVRSWQDVRILADKLQFLLPRITGPRVWYTDVPPSLQLEPTNHCNLRCISCPRDRMTRRKGYMEFGLFKKIIDDAAGEGVKRVHLYLHGEPLLHPEIANMIAYIKSRGMGITLTTNGMLLDREKALSILQSGVNSADYFTFSMLGCSSQVHEGIMRGVNHERVVQNITDLLKTRKERGINGPIVQTIFYQMPENAHEAHDYMTRWKDVVDQALFVAGFSESFAHYKHGNGAQRVRRRTCKQIWERMTIHWNGDVSLCCEDVDGDIVLGNLEKQSVRELWSKQGLLAVRRLHREKRFAEMPLCKTCDL